jgi:hypothetical protein
MIDCGQLPNSLLKMNLSSNEYIFICANKTGKIVFAAGLTATYDRWYNV